MLFDKAEQKVFMDDNWDQNYDQDDGIVEVKGSFCFQKQCLRKNE